uniref:Uncharacterized protein n=2 Tax=Aegilops tauschii subsp. strangulata TaxID=200361 RepID=A0A453N2N5_AEGTS
MPAVGVVIKLEATFHLTCTGDYKLRHRRALADGEHDGRGPPSSSPDLHLSPYNRPSEARIPPTSAACGRLAARHLCPAGPASNHRRGAPLPSAVFAYLGQPHPIPSPAKQKQSPTD